MITIKNRQRKIKIDTVNLKALAQKMLESIKYNDFDLGILLTTNRAIRKYNKQYRKKDKPTDILSFGYHQLKPGEHIKVEEPEDKNIGDLILSLEYIKKDAPRWNQTFDERIPILIAHGIAHLLGYDHETEEGYKQMQKIEKMLLRVAK